MGRLYLSEMIFVAIIISANVLATSAENEPGKEDYGYGPLDKRTIEKRFWPRRAYLCKCCDDCKKDSFVRFNSCNAFEDVCQTNYAGLEGGLCCKRWLS